jgi:hypothetical protein
LRDDRDVQARAEIGADTSTADDRATGEGHFGGRQMTLTVRRLLLLIAVILFVVSAVGVDVRGISLVAAGLAFFAASFLAPDTVVGRRM